MQLQGCWVLLVLVELLSEALRKHFVDSQISQERVIFSNKAALVFVLFEFSLKFVKTNHFGDARNVKVRNLVFERASRVFYKNTHSRELVFGLERAWKNDLKRSC